MRSRPRTPFRLVPAALVAVTALALTACSSGPAKPSASPTTSNAVSASACAKPGSASNAVQVNGKAGSAPTVKFPLPTSTSATQRTVLKAGSGDTVKAGASVQIAYSLYDGKNGKLLDSSGYGAKKPVILTADTTQYLPGLVQALVCGRAGERFASVIPASAAFGSAGSEQLGVGGGDSLVLVADILELTPTKATGALKALPASFPKVTTAANGTPSVKIPATSAPKSLEIADRRVGTGETVRSGDTVTVQYQGVLWRTGSIFDQSWGKTGPTSFATTAVVKGFGKALVGQKIGSQVVAIVPADQGYGSKGSSDGSIKGTDVMVFVIDVLATTHAA
ncbi:FKBP-type peptidyl-prolyl cis-trans isomerase [Amnibacterium sp. CER49]|uniref:FKBP-type peptidyl-prolyl cis-trans isomerase n=1 Tax=Amnibacterium sp. CER49 TaxID=3039161 RepID=UPI00244BE838|nr:FKBP-type peptidyl-prolyl cis-trans isomerase [Amnibacterium sp. CER49]MDH2445079.1 FKBP-type peptidyl-prolyl cis-trans isomerase [Amnibacterium sp. CER49]